MKVRDSTNQLIVRLLLQNHGRPRRIGAEGWGFITKRECVWVKLSANKTERLADSMINPAITGLPSKRHSATG